MVAMWRVWFEREFRRERPGWVSWNCWLERVIRGMAGEPS